MHTQTRGGPQSAFTKCKQHTIKSLTQISSGRIAMCPGQVLPVIGITSTAGSVWFRVQQNYVNSSKKPSSYADMTKGASRRCHKSENSLPLAACNRHCQCHFLMHLYLGYRVSIAACTQTPGQPMHNTAMQHLWRLCSCQM